MKDGLMDHVYSNCVTITNKSILLFKKGIKRLCTKLYKEVIVGFVGSTINFDPWSEYIKLSDYGYNHYVVNHNENFVDSISKAPTQRIESYGGLRG